MEQRINMVTLGVADLQRSRQFYEKLGWLPSNESNKNIVFFQAGGMVLGLFSRKQLAEEANQSDELTGFDGVTLSYNVRKREEVNSVLEEAEKADATVLKPASETTWGGYSGYFADPDGHSWEVAWNPYWSINEDGSIKLPG